MKREEEKRVGVTYLTLPARASTEWKEEGRRSHIELEVVTTGLGTRAHTMTEACRFGVLA
jgi:hypothetical protein